MKRMVIWFFAASLGLAAAPVLARDKDDKGHAHQALKFDDLPAPVQKALTQEAQGGQIQEVRKENEGGQVVYEAEVVTNGKGRDIEMSADGKVLKRGPAHDEENEKAQGHEHR